MLFGRYLPAPRFSPVFLLALEVSMTWVGVPLGGGSGHAERGIFGEQPQPLDRL